MNYFDIQVNGYGGVDFNSEKVSAADLNTACAKLKQDGVEGFLATIITEDIPRMCTMLSQLSQLRQRDSLVKEMLVGFHIEGPFLNPEPGYRGAHPADAICPANLDDMKRLLEAAEGLTRIVTLAPECDDALAVTTYLAKQGLTVAAGHCNPSRDELEAAIDAGLTLFTHFGNGTPLDMPRHDNIIQCALSLSDRLMFSLIADGAHLPIFVLKNFFNAIGLDHCIITTDAIAPAGLGPGRYTLGRWNLLIGEDLVARSPDGSHLIGSAVSMLQAERNLRTHFQWSDEDIRKIMYDNPRKIAGFGL